MGDSLSANLAESYGRALALFTELNPSPLLRFDSTGRIQLANAAALKTFTCGNLVGQVITDFVPELSLGSLGELINSGGRKRCEWDSDGRFYVFELRGVPELGAGLLYGFDVTALKSAEAALQRQRQRLQRHNAALLRLAHDAELFAGDTHSAAKRITRAAGETIGVARSSVWLLRQDDSGIELLDLFRLEGGLHESGLALEAHDFIDYFAAIHTERSIIAHDARNHAATRCFRESYLAPLGITSMLDIPVRRGANTVGVLCCEHVGPQREWAVDEVNFATGLAALFSQALEIAQRSA